MNSEIQIFYPFCDDKTGLAARFCVGQSHFMMQGFMPRDKLMSNTLFDVTGHIFPAFFTLRLDCRIVLIYPDNDHFSAICYKQFYHNPPDRGVIFKQYDDPLSAHYMMFARF